MRRHKMPYRCNKARRRKLNTPCERLCTPGEKCCMINTLKCRPDFSNQKCKLEEVCDSCGVTFHLLPICHPELNPIEGNYLKNCTTILPTLPLIYKFANIDFWNCTKRCARAKCDYTLYGACAKICHLHFYQLRSTGCEKRLNARTDTFLCTL